MKRLIALLLAISMVFGTVSPAFAAGLSEKPDNNIELEGSTENGVAKVKLLLPKDKKVHQSFLIQEKQNQLKHYKLMVKKIHLLKKRMLIWK